MNTKKKSNTIQMLDTAVADGATVEMHIYSEAEVLHELNQKRFHSVHKGQNFLNLYKPFSYFEANDWSKV